MSRFCVCAGDGRQVMPLGRVALEFGISEERLEAFVEGYAASHEGGSPRVEARATAADDAEAGGMLEFAQWYHWRVALLDALKAIGMNSESAGAFPAKSLYCFVQMVEELNGRLEESMDNECNGNNDRKE